MIHILHEVVMKILKKLPSGRIICRGWPQDPGGESPIGKIDVDRSGSPGGFEKLRGAVSARHRCHPGTSLG